MAKRTEYQIAIDDALTKHLNAEDRIHDFLAKCTADLHKAFRDIPDVFFYLKGSAALHRYLLRAGTRADVLDAICQRSDWDTQLVIDPRLPRAQWFEVFQQCLQIIRSKMAGYEKELLDVLAQVFLSESAASPAARSERNAFAGKVRAAVSASFGEKFLTTSVTEGFTEGPMRWELDWDQVRAAGAQGAILDLEIQAHSQAVLTFALIHPGQALGNLNSIVTGRELRELAEQTRIDAEKAWQAVEEASAEYDSVWAREITRSRAAVELVNTKIATMEFEESVIGSLPDKIKIQVARRFSHEEKATISGAEMPMTLDEEEEEEEQASGSERSPIDLWRDVEGARHAGGPDEDRISAANEAFNRMLRTRLAGDRSVARELRDCLQRQWTNHPAMVLALAESCNAEIAKALGEPAELQAAQRRLQQLLEVYHEEPDPEDAAEARKRETERLAPFTLVSVTKGSLQAGSILENMSIRDFYLFRLMIRCQLNNKDPYRLIPEARTRAAMDTGADMDADMEGEAEAAPEPETDFDTLKQQFKFRAELLDISVPRDDSLETAEQWAHVKDHIGTDEHGIPLPDGRYFMDEYFLLFREVLDRKSSSVHKFRKRLQRACAVAEVYAGQLAADGRLTQMAAELAAAYPLFAAMAGGAEHNSNANLLVFMRMCEQLVESYDLEQNLRLRDDSALMMRSFAGEIRHFLKSRLSEDSYLALMRIYAHLGKLIYNYAFVLAGARPQKAFSPDHLVGTVAPRTMAWIAEQFANDPARFRCAVVEDFAIAMEPDLPEPLKRDLPLNVLTIIAYTDEDLDGDRMEELACALEKLLTLVLRTDTNVSSSDTTLYARYLQKAPHESGEPQGQSDTAALSVFLKVKFVVDKHAENWIAPAHERDLKSIVTQYRRSLPAYTEYYALSRKKEILEQLERILTTY